MPPQRRQRKSPKPSRLRAFDGLGAWWDNPLIERNAIRDFMNARGHKPKCAQETE